MLWSLLQMLSKLKMKLHLAARRCHSMDTIDDQTARTLTEQALKDLRERIDALQSQNKDLKDFIRHMGIEVSSFLNYTAITKEL